MAVRRLRSGASNVAPTSQEDEDELVQKLRRGELDREAFFDALVERSLAHVAGRMPPEQLEVVREQMRDQVESNPVLVEIVRQATRGAVGSPPG